MEKIKSIKDINIKGKKVLIRVDFNCPMNKDGTVADDNRIRGAIPTIEYALSQDAKVILVSHLGRPDGKKDPKYTLQGVGEKLAELMKIDVVFVEDCIGAGVWAVLENMKSGSVALLENVRFYKKKKRTIKILHSNLQNFVTFILVMRLEQSTGLTLPQLA